MIKKSIIVFVFSILFITVSCKKEDTSNPSKREFAKMDFSKRVHDFGTINDTAIVKTEFIFTNSGDTDLIISQIEGNCGCTVPEYSREPIKPGKKGVIKVAFNPIGRSGVQNKTITIVVNTYTGMENIEIKAVVNKSKSK